MDKFEIEFYTKQNGEKPAKDFILSLDIKMRAKLLGIMDVLERYGTQLREQLAKAYREDFLERVKSNERI